MENVWEYMRGNDLSHRVWDGYEVIIAACCTGCNKLMQMPARIASLTRRSWAKTVVGQGRWYQRPCPMTDGGHSGRPPDCRRMTGLGGYRTFSAGERTAIP